MKTRNYCLALAAFAIALTDRANAALLVDINASSPTQNPPAFTGLAGSTSPPYVTSATNVGGSGYDVTIFAVGAPVGDGVYPLDRGAIASSGGFTYGDLYRDMLFATGNDGNHTRPIQLSIANVIANAEYDVKLYSYDPAISQTVAFNPTGSTSGTSAGYSYVGIGGAALASNDQYSGTIRVKSTTTTLDILISKVGVSGTDVSFNGFEISAVPVPEPSAMLLLGIAGLGFIRIARSRKR
jgi:hypothetical protein